MRFSAALLAFSAALVSADVANYTSDLDMTIDASTIDSSTRATWCGAQEDTCNTLCDDDTNSNTCTQSTLNWTCTCASNDSQPGIQYYTQTVPYFICEELYSECIADNTDSATEQALCKTNIADLCGSLTAELSDSTTTSAAATKTKSSSSSTASSDSSATTSASASDSFAAPTMAPAVHGVAAAAALGMLAYMI